MYRVTVIVSCSCIFLVLGLQSSIPLIFCIAKMCCYNKKGIIIISARQRVRIPCDCYMARLGGVRLAPMKRARFLSSKWIPLPLHLPNAVKDTPVG